MAAPPSDDLTERLLRRVIAARRRGDGVAMKAAWEQLVLAEFPRVRTVIATYRNPSLPGGRVPREDHDDVAQDAFLKLRAIVLEGSSVGEARALIRRATTFALHEYARQHVRHDVERAGSLDDQGDDPDVDTGGVARQAELDAAARRTDDAELALLRDDLLRGLQAVDPNKREIVSLTLKGYGGDEIAERLELTRDNVFQRRRRGLAQLRAAMDGGA